VSRPRVLSAVVVLCHSGKSLSEKGGRINKGKGVRE
jgi:hypothetical protein